MLRARPAEQSDSTQDEPPYDDLVLPAVALEAHRRHVLLLGTLAYGQVVAQAEGAVALRA